MYLQFFEMLFSFSHGSYKFFHMACRLAEFLALGKIEMMPLLFHPFLLPDSECKKHDCFDLIMCQ